MNIETIQGILVDHSGSITAGGTSQQILPRNKHRRCLFFQNLSTEDMYLNFTVAASAGGSSILIPSLSSFSMSAVDFISVEPINVVAATTGSKFVCKEG